MPKSKLPIDLNTAIAHGLRPDWFMRDRLGTTPDIWQEQLLRSRSKQVIINAGRQIGKSTVVAAAALHCCLYQPGALVLVIAPSQRQSRELFIKIHDFLGRLEPAEKLEEETKLSFVMANGSRAVVLPGDGRTIRGYSSPALILMDEAAFIPDEVFDATLPMLAASSEGRIFLLSTPYTPAGFFYQIWHNAEMGALRNTDSRVSARLERVAGSSTERRSAPFRSRILLYLLDCGRGSLHPSNARCNGG